MIFVLRIVAWLLFCLLCCMAPQACSPPNTACEGENGSQFLNPNKSVCTRKCDCNNHRYTGDCIQKLCYSFKRSSCESPGLQQPCIDPLTQCEGRQECAPENIDGKFWGDCICPTQPEASQEPQREQSNEADRAELPADTSEPTQETPRERVPEPHREPGEPVDTREALDVDEPPNDAVDEPPGDAADAASPDTPPDAASPDTPPDAASPDTPPDAANPDTPIERDERPGDIGIIDGSTEPDSVVDAGESTQEPPEQSGETSHEEGNRPETGEHNPEAPGEQNLPPCGNQLLYLCSLAGDGVAGYANGQGSNARFGDPSGLAADTMGNLYVSDFRYNRIRRVDPFGTVTDFAGTGLAGGNDGPRPMATFSIPVGLAFNTQGELFLAEYHGNRIRRIDTNGQVSTIAGMGPTSLGSQDGPANQATFRNPGPIAIAPNGDIYVADYTGHRIRRISQVTNATCGSQNNYTGHCVSSFAGNGTAAHQDGRGTSAWFNNPHGLAFDASGNLYVADQSNHRIRRIDTNGNTTTIAGSGAAGGQDGPAATAQFDNPGGLAIDHQSGQIYIAELNGHRIRLYDPQNNTVRTLAGSTAGTSGAQDGPGTQALLHNPHTIALYRHPTTGYLLLYVTELAGKRIRWMRVQ